MEPTCQPICVTLAVPLARGSFEALGLKSKPMLLLDCESLDTAIHTSAAILGISDRELRDRVKSFDYDRVPRAEQQQHPYEALVVRHALGYSPEELPVDHACYWHHATRVSATEQFIDGILPLPLIIDRLWHMLGELARDWSSTNEWKSFRPNMRGQGAQQYWGKFSFQPGGGPFAFLVRPVILSGERLGNHNYLGIPEIVEDICMAYEEMFGHDLAARFIDSSRPCIVRFRSHKPWPGALQAALVFMHSALSGGGLSRHGNTCFDGRGEAVPVSDIVKIEWLEA